MAPSRSPERSPGRLEAHQQARAVQDDLVALPQLPPECVEHHPGERQRSHLLLDREAAPDPKEEPVHVHQEQDACCRGGADHRRLDGTLPASAATPECGSSCISIFSRALGTYDQPNFVEAVLDGRAQVGQPLILKQASSFDSSEDLIPRGGLVPVSDLHMAGMVSAAVNHHYGDRLATQIEYAPLGMLTGLCVGLESVASQGQGLTLQSCSVPGRTVWIVSPPQPLPGTSRWSTARRRTSHARTRWTTRAARTRRTTRLRISTSAT